MEFCDLKYQKISREVTRACMCHDAGGNYLWSRKYIPVTSVHFVCHTVFRVAANVRKSGQGVLGLHVSYREQKKCVSGR